MSKTVYSRKTLEDFLPHMAVENGCVMSKRGDLTFGWRVWLPTAYTVNEAGYDSIINSFQQAYRLLPPYCVVHKQDVFRMETYHAADSYAFLGVSYENHFDGRRFLSGICYIFLTFSSKATLDGKTGDSGMFGIMDRKVPDAARIEYCAGVASQFASILANNALLVLKVLSSDDFVGQKDGADTGVIADYLNLYSDNGNVVFPPEFRPDCVKVGDDYAKVWYIEDSDSMPGMVRSVSEVSSMSTMASKVYLSGGSPIGYGLKIPHVVNRYVVTLPKATIEHELDQRRRFMTSFSLYSSACRVNAEELSSYLEEAALHNLVTVKCFTDVVAWGKAEELGDIRNNVVTAFTNMGVQATESTLDCPQLFYAGIPAAAAELGSDCYMNSENTSFFCLGLWDGYDQGIKGGALRICDRNRMNPLPLDIQTVAREAGYIDNLNGIIVGPSGSGKSFTTNKIVYNMWMDGQHVFIIDVGDSYEITTKIINEETGGRDGIYYSYDPDHPFSFNPFRNRSHWGDVDEDGERINSGLDFLLSLVETMYMPKDGWTNSSTGILNSIFDKFFEIWDEGPTDVLLDNLKEAYANGRRARARKNSQEFDEAKRMTGFKNPLPKIFSDDKRKNDPVFDDFYQYVTQVVGPLIEDENFFVEKSRIRKDMFDVDNFGVALSKYRRDGEYGFLLNAETDVDLFKSRFTVFEVDKIKDNKDLFPLWTLCIMHSFEDKMRNLPGKKVMVVEEAWKAISIDTMANYIVWMWRTARKFQTSAIIVTQSVNDLLSSAIVKDAIIQNSAVKILLDQRKNANNFENSSKMLGLTPKDVSLVLSVNQNLNPHFRYKEGFFAIGESYSNVFAIEVSPEEALAYESDKVKKRPTLERAKVTGSVIEAIRQIVSERNK